MDHLWDIYEVSKEILSSDLLGQLKKKFANHFQQYFDFQLLPPDVLIQLKTFDGKPLTHCFEVSSLSLMTSPMGPKFLATRRFKSKAIPPPEIRISTFFSVSKILCALYTSAYTLHSKIFLIPAFESLTITARQHSTLTFKSHPVDDVLILSFSFRWNCVRVALEKTHS